MVPYLSGRRTVSILSLVINIIKNKTLRYKKIFLCAWTIYLPVFSAGVPLVSTVVFTHACVVCFLVGAVSRVVSPGLVRATGADGGGLSISSDPDLRTGWCLAIGRNSVCFCLYEKLELIIYANSLLYICLLLQCKGFY